MMIRARERDVLCSKQYDLSPQPGSLFETQTQFSQGWN